MKDNGLVVFDRDPEVIEKIQALPVPDCLKGPLVFGDKEQIAAYQNIQAKAEEIAEVARQKREGLIKEFDVHLSFSGDQYVRVWAATEAEAIEKAKDEFDPCDVHDAEIDDVFADEVGRRRRR